MLSTHFDLAYSLKTVGLFAHYGAIGGTSLQAEDWRYSTIPSMRESHSYLVGYFWGREPHPSAQTTKELTAALMEFSLITGFMLSKSRAPGAVLPVGTGRAVEVAFEDLG